MNILPSPATIDEKFLKQLKKFFLNFNSLKDIGKSRLYDEELECLRNESGACIRSPLNGGRVYRPKPPNLELIGDHLIFQGDRTLWMTNGGAEYSIWLCIDIDSDGGPDVDAVVAVLSEILPLYTEPSTNGKGRHCFLKFFRQYVKSEDIWSVVEQMVGIFRENFRDFDVKVDLITGVPTVWTGPMGQKRIVKRGVPIRLPYCPDGIEPLRQLPEVKMDDLRKLIQGGIPQRYMGGTKPRCREDEWL